MSDLEAELQRWKEKCWALEEDMKCRNEMSAQINALRDFEWKYRSLVEACMNNCDDRTLDNLATVTQDRALLRGNHG